MVTGGDPRPVPGLRRGALLAVLALSPGDVVSTDRLIDIIWNGRPPVTALNTLQRHVSALRGLLSQHAANGTFGVLDGSGFSEPSTRTAVDLLAKWGQELPLVVVTTDEPNVAKSFRNLEKVVVTTPAGLEVAALVWAKSVLVTEDALELVKAKAS